MKKGVLYLLPCLLVTAFACTRDDTNCRKKELLVILELYKHYKELMHYRNLVSKTLDRTAHTQNHQFASNGSVQDHVVHDISGGSTPAIRSTTDLPRTTTVDSSLEQHKQVLTSTMNELSSIVSEVKNILLLVLLSPGRITTEQLNVILNTLNSQSRKIATTSTTIAPSTPSPLVTTSIPYWPTTINILTMFGANRNRNKVAARGKKRSGPNTITRKQIKTKPKTGMQSKFTREFIKDVKDMALEYNEAVTEYKAYQQVLRMMLGRR